MRAQAAGLVGDLTQAVAAIEVVHLHLVPLLAIRGLVRDAQERPLSGASVAAVSPSAGRVVLSSTASDGTFVIDEVPADKLFVVAWKDGYGMEQQPVSEEGQVTAAMLLMARPTGPWTPVFDLVRTHAVSGRVVRGKAPVPHARVEVKDQRCTLKVVADEAGQFAAEGVGAGAVDIDAASGASHGRTAVKVAQEDVRGVVVLLGDGAFVEGRMVDQSGRPASGMQVNVTTKTLPQHGASAETDPDGLYEAGPLEPGQYSVNFSPRHCRAAGPVQVSLVAGQRARVDFTLDAGAAIKGRVIDSQGAPVASAWIHERMGMHGFGRGPPSFGHATSGDDGSFVMDGLSPGAHSFDVRADGFAEKSVDLTAPADAVAIALVKGLRCPGRDGRRRCDGAEQGRP